MAILKLPNVNDTHTGHVSACEQVTGTYGEQVKFGFEGGDLLFLPADSAHRQLLHAGFPDVGEDATARADLHAVAGNTLAFFRSPNKKAGSAPYWNVTIANGAPPAPSKRLAGPDTATATPTTVPGVAPKAQTPVSQSTTTSAMSKALTAPATRSRAQVAAAYQWALATAHAAQVATLGSTDAAAVQAGAATLLIQLEKSGLIWEPLTIAAVVQALDATPPSRYEEPLPPEPDEDFLPF
jgi:hypothetical protein